jgi:hypothetical protein
MSTDLAKASLDAAIIERVIIAGDLSKLAPQERVSYYRNVCASLGLNELTKPFEYITLNGKLTLYATRNCTDQLRQLKGVSVSIATRERLEDIYVVTARATLPDGRCDESIGAVNIAGLRGEALANALMKAETKAKRRATLSLCGLSFSDETEAETIPGAQRVVVDTSTGEIVENGSDRKRLIGELRALVDEARSLGLDPVVGKPADMTDADMRQAADVIRRMVEAEREYQATAAVVVDEAP